MAQEIVTVVTGANRGLGRAVARRLATIEGHHVVATARNPVDLETLATEVVAAGGKIDCQRLDVTDAASAADLARWLKERFGRVDVLINNAGISLENFKTSILDLPLDALQHTLEHSVWVEGGCGSWYLDHRGRNTTLWPEHTWRFRRQTRRFHPGEYTVRA